MCTVTTITSWLPSDKAHGIHSKIETVYDLKIEDNTNTEDKFKLDNIKNIRNNISHAKKTVKKWSKRNQQLKGILARIEKVYRRKFC